MSTTAHLLRQASHAARAGRLSHAEQSLRRLLRLVPRNTQARTQMVQLCLLRRDYTAAACHQQVLCEVQPQCAPHWVRLVHCLNMAGEPERAQAALQSAADAGMDMSLLQRLEAQLAHPPLLRQQMLLAQYQQRSDALTCEIAAHLFIGDYPDHPLGWQILGALQHDAGRYAEALETQQQTVERFPDDANAWSNLALTQLATGDTQAALESADKALARDPSHASAVACKQRARAQTGHAGSGEQRSDLAAELGRSLGQG